MGRKPLLENLTEDLHLSFRGKEECEIFEKFKELCIKERVSIKETILRHIIEFIDDDEIQKCWIKRPQCTDEKLKQYVWNKLQEFCDKKERMNQERLIL